VLLTFGKIPLAAPPPRLLPMCVWQKSHAVMMLVEIPVLQLQVLSLKLPVLLVLLQRGQALLLTIVQLTLHVEINSRDLLHV
jgi:hypothetical protein